MKRAETQPASGCLRLLGVEKRFSPRRSLRELARLRSPSTVEVLAGADLEVGLRETVCLMGANGSGKTTLLRLAAGVLLPNSGRVTVLGKNPAASASARSAIGFLSSSERSFYWRLSARRNLLFWGSLQGLCGGALRRAVEEAAYRTGCSSIMDKDFQDLSTGMRQRVGLARAIMHSPRLLLLDEPTRSMDAGTAESFAELVRELAESGRAVLMTTHSTEEAGGLGDATYRIENGRLNRIEPDAGPVLLVRFRGRARGDPPAGVVPTEDGLRCRASRLPAALEWLERGALPVVGIGRPEEGS